MEISWSVKTVAGSSCLRISKSITLTSNPIWNFTEGVTLATEVKTKKGNKTEDHFLEDAVLSYLGRYELLTQGEGGGGCTSLCEANGDVPLNGVAFSRLD